MVTLENDAILIMPLKIMLRWLPMQARETITTMTRIDDWVLSIRIIL